jgi:hypothetical protein
MTILAAIPALLAVLLWAALVATFLNLHSSDAAGNGLAQVYAVVNIVALWAVLLIVVVIGMASDGGPGWMKASAVLLTLFSGAAAMAALVLMTDRAGAPAKWALAIPIFVPPLLIAYAPWAYIAPLRDAVPVTTVALALGVPVLILSLSPWLPLLQRQQATAERRATNDTRRAAQQAAQDGDQRQAQRAKLASYTRETPLWDWLSLADRNSPVRDEALAAVQTLPRRQADAELMLARGMGWPLLELPNLNVEATPELCARARATLAKRARDFRPVNATPPPFAMEARNIEMFFPAMQWLVAHECDCTAELAEVANSVRAYPDSPERQKFLDRLAQLR